MTRKPDKSRTGRRRAPGTLTLRLLLVRLFGDVLDRVLRITGMLGPTGGKGQSWKSKGYCNFAHPALAGRQEGIRVGCFPSAGLRTDRGC